MSIIDLILKNFINFDNRDIFIKFIVLYIDLQKAQMYIYG